jgi:hypothetical protein
MKTSAVVSTVLEERIGGLVDVCEVEGVVPWADVVGQGSAFLDDFFAVWRFHRLGGDRCIFFEIVLESWQPLGSEVVRLDAGAQVFLRGKEVH